MRRTAGVTLIFAGGLVTLLGVAPLIAIATSELGQFDFVRVVGWVIAHWAAGVAALTVGIKILRNRDARALRLGVFAAAGCVAVCVVFAFFVGVREASVLYGGLATIACIGGVLAAVAHRRNAGTASAA